MDCYLAKALNRVDEMRAMQEWMTEVETLFPAQDLSQILLHEFRWDLTDVGCQKGLERLCFLIKQQQKQE